MSAQMTKKIGVEAIKALREKTGASLNDVRQALESAGGDEAKALAHLRERGAAIAEKRSGRATGQGRIEAYIHHDGRLGAIVEVGCETDFVARTPDFVQFSKDVAMQVAAMGPEDLDGLMKQPFVKDQGTSVQELLKALIAKTGENVVIKRFSRFGLGETPSA
jgi:elongation factor Ts